MSSSSSSLGFHKLNEKQTIVISSEEQTNGIEAPAITFAALKNDGGAVAMGWKSVEQNLTFETFAVFNHCQRMNLTNMEACLKNGTVERDEFLKSARLGLSEENSTFLLVDESSSSIWSEDLAASFLGRQYTLKPPMNLATGTNGYLMFQLDNSFDYLIWLHDETFFLPNQNPLGPPNKRWQVLPSGQNFDGLYHLITVTKHKKLNLDRQPCEEDLTYSFVSCTKEKISQKIGCRLPLDRWSQQDRKICETENEIKQYEQMYREFYLLESDEIEEKVGCRKPCTYNEFKFVHSSPQTLPSMKNYVGLGAASRKTRIEKEVLHYPLTSFIAEFGGALGLFLGFSFMTVWQEIRACFGK